MNTLNTLNTVKPRAIAQSAAPEMNFASKSVPRHLGRGAIGFGLIIGSIALVPVVGPVTLLAAPLALIAFRGCPTCWMVGLAQTISRGRLERQCVDGVCTLTKAHPSAVATDEPRSDTVPGRDHGVDEPSGRRADCVPEQVGWVEGGTEREAGDGTALGELRRDATEL